MQCIVSPATNSYTFILTEDEWYSGTTQQQAAWQVQCKREAGEHGCRHANILVDPDATLSISPNPHKHRVWGYTFPLREEEALVSTLIACCEAAKGLTRAQKLVCLRKAFDQL